MHAANRIEAIFLQQARLAVLRIFMTDRPQQSVIMVYAAAAQLDGFAIE